MIWFSVFVDDGRVKFEKLTVNPTLLFVEYAGNFLGIHNQCETTAPPETKWENQYYASKKC